jgi:hypothetical protein
MKHVTGFLIWLLDILFGVAVIFGIVLIVQVIIFPQENLLLDFGKWLSSRQF